MFAGFAKLAGFGSAFPYTLGAAYPSAWGQWTHYDGTSTSDGQRVSVFKISAEDPNDRRLVAARNGVKRLKLVRHPNILSFKDSYELTERGATVIYLVTQPVQPLKMALEELNLEGQHRDEYLAMSILHMTNAVSFLNNDCKLIHGGICIDAVVVTETLDPKLHGFDLLSEHTLPGLDFSLQAASWMVGNQYKPAELGKLEWDVVRDSPPWAIDAWGLGCLIQEICSCKSMTSVEDLRRTDVIPAALLGDYQKLLSSNPPRRLNPSKVAECKFLHCKLVDVVNFMENIAVKDGVEKDTFFKRLPNILPSIPPAVSIRKILPQLSSALEFGGAPAHAVGSLMVIGKLLEGDEFTKRVVPTLSKLFASTDRGLRRSLLESMDSYGPHLTTPVIEEQIYPQLQTGFTDANAYIRELTLKSMLALAPRMSNKTLTQNVLKHLSKLQVDEEPSIRANTTVLLGNVAQYLGEATCKRVLLNAFTRALKDAFPPAKIAGLRAMVATAQYHGPEDAALRILPAVAPMCIDPIGEVRSSALQCLDTFSKNLKDYDVKATAAAAAAAAAAGDSSTGGASSMGGAPSIASGSMLTWAVSSLMTSTGLAIKAAPSPVQQPAAAAGSSHVSAAPSATPTRSSSSATAARPTSAATSAGGGIAPRTSVPTTVTAVTSDGWGDDDGDLLGGGLAGDGWEEDDEEAKARSRLTARPSASSARDRSSTMSKVGGSLKTEAKTSPSSSGWEDAGDAAGDNDKWDDMDAGVASKAAAAGPRPRAAASRPAAMGAKPKGTAGSMKLGAQKLGVQKLGAPKIDLDDL